MRSSLIQSWDVRARMHTTPISHSSRQQTFARCWPCSLAALPSNSPPVEAAVPSEGHRPQPLPSDSLLPSRRIGCRSPEETRKAGGVLRFQEKYKHSTRIIGKDKETCTSKSKSQHLRVSSQTRCNRLSRPFQVNKIGVGMNQNDLSSESSNTKGTGQPDDTYIRSTSADLVRNM